MSKVTESSIFELVLSHEEVRSPQTHFFKIYRVMRVGIKTPVGKSKKSNDNNFATSKVKKITIDLLSLGIYEPGSIAVFETVKSYQ